MKIKNKKLYMKLLATALGVTVTTSTIGASCYAGAPKVETDEAVYANLDYYGAVDSVSVVKGCSMNGNTEIVDYGTYDNVTNMSNRAEPTIEDGKVIWKLPEGTEQFYYECESKELATNIPWDLDVTYKLNGVETAGEDLAGASGMVTIDIKATPNTKAPEYYKNNLILSCATLVDMSKELSIDAPGSQLQSVGTYKAVVFMAMPGEEGDFQINIGTESFESMGVFFMMVPATLESLDMISDVADVKDTVRDSVNAMSDSTDVILDSLQSMKSGLQQVQEGAKQAKAAKATFDSEREPLEASIDATVDSMYNLTQSLNAMDPHFGEAKRIADDASLRIGDIATGMVAIKETLDGMNDVNKQMRHSLTNLSDTLAKLGSDSNLEQLQAQLEADAKNSGIHNGGTSAETVAEKSSDRSDAAISALIEQYQTLAKELGGNAAVDLGYASHDMLSKADDVSDELQSIITQLKALQNSYSDDYVKEIKKFIDDCNVLVDTTEQTIWVTGIAIRNMRIVMESTENDVSASLDNSLNGMIGIAGGAINATDGTETLRNAKDVMKNAIDDELDKIEEDTNVFNIDTSLPFPSFTSSKNETPASIQIIMRTKEISIDDVKENVDLEPVKENIGVWGRVKAVFQKMFGWIGKK